MKYTENELETLNALYESQFWSTFKKALIERRQKQLVRMVMTAEDFAGVQYNRGGYDTLEWLDAELKEINKIMLKRESKDAQG